MVAPQPHTVGRTAGQPGWVVPQEHATPRPAAWDEEWDEEWLVALNAAARGVAPLSEQRRGTRIRDTRVNAARLATAALALFARRGFDTVTVGEIAAEAGVTARTFYPTLARMSATSDTLAAAGLLRTTVWEGHLADALRRRFPALTPQDADIWAYTTMAMLRLASDTAHRARLGFAAAARQVFAGLAQLRER